MSEPTTSAPVSTPPSPVTEPISAPNTVLFPETPAPETPPETPAPAAPPVDTGYKINTLENGQQEVTLQTGQVYRGTPDQVLNELAKAQFNASQRITELGRLVPPPAPPAPTGPQIDPTAKALADLTAQGMGFSNAEEYMAEVNQVKTYYQKQHQDANVKQFLSENPDFPATNENGEKIDAIVTQLGMEPNPLSWQIVHNHLKATGQYNAVAPPVQAPRAPGMPLPPTGTTAVSAEQDPWAMPLDQLRNLATGRS